jgi:hypothetical protein
MKPQILESSIDVGNYLEQKLGVSQEHLIQIVLAGVAGRNNCTPNHPSGMPGTMCWGEATREMREVFLPRGYEKDDTDNIPSVYHKERRVKIAICNSDSGTGLTHSHPQPTRSKGDGAKRAVFPNEGVLKGILESSLNEVQSGQRDVEMFWYLCIYCDEDAFRAELLSPILKEDGSFKDSCVRIILVSDGNQGTSGGIRREGPADDSGFDVPVLRKIQASAK